MRSQKTNQTKKAKTMTTTKTDKQRLNAAFAELRKRGFVAKQRHMCCQSCGWAALPAEAPNVVFYHAQDADSLKNGELRCAMYLAHRFESEAKGREACAVLQSHGFTTEWDGSENTRICIDNAPQPKPEVKPAVVSNGANGTAPATTQRPSIVTDEHLEYLDALRESGVTNMFGARPYVENEFSVSKSDATTILSYWMRSFGDPNR